jgi:lysophospholipase L1-like esterase
VAVSISLIGASIYIGYRALGYRRHVNYFLEKYTFVVEGFSGRQKYAEDNLRMVATAGHRDRVVFIGDQIIESWPLDRYFTEFEAVNRGITGQWLAGFVLRLRPDVLELKPRAAVIQFSSYNFRPQNVVAETKDYVANITELCRYHGVEPVLTTVIPVRENEDVYRSEGFEPYFVADTLDLFNDWLRGYCRENGLALIDFFAALADDKGYLPTELSIDNTHLTEAGFQRLAEATRPVLTSPGSIRAIGKREIIAP